MTELVVRGVREAFEVVPAPDMAGDGQRTTTGLPLHLVGHLLARLDAAAGDDDIGAVTGEGEHHLPPEPTAPAGDEGHLARQVDVHQCAPWPARMRRARLASIPTLSPRLAMRSSVLSPRT